MKLRIVPASAGIQWVKLGIRTFFRQPLAMSGLFLLFLALMSLLSLIPVIGNVVALAILPGASLGLMAATEQATQGKFPMPAIMLSAFRAGRVQLRSMLVLGALYAAGFLLALGISATLDGGQFARLYLFGGELSPATVVDPGFELAVLLAMALYLPLSLLFWHAPALVYWHGVTPAKSLFFSMVACMRNFWAFTVYSLAWLAVFLSMGLLLTLLMAVFGTPEGDSGILVPLAMLMAAMYFTSLYFTFRDCFDPELPAPVQDLLA